MNNMLQNKLIKDNRLTFLILAVSALVSLVMLIFVTIQALRWSSYKEQTENARSEIASLIKKRPSPGKENEKRLKEDAELYKARVKELVLPDPLQPAVDKFFETLEPPLESAFSSPSELAKYKVPGTGIKADPKKGTPAVPVKIRKLTQQEFLEFFKKRFDDYCNKNVAREDRKWASALNGFMLSYNHKFFPAGNWDKAVKAFVNEAKKATFEPINDATKVSILLMAIGFERKVEKEIASSQAHIDNMKIGINKYAVGKKMSLFSSAEAFIGGGSGDAVSSRGSEDSGYKAEDYPALLFHWDVYGDIVKRLADANVATLNQVVVRARKNSDEKRSDVIDLRSSVENAGDFRVSHYTVVITGKMSAIRDAVRNFDAAVKDNRMYVVRSVFLQAKENGAAALMGQGDETLQLDEADKEQPRRVSTSRRSGQRREASAERSRSEEEQARLDRDAKLPPEKRSDYGMIYVGGDEESIAYIDIDYIVLAK